MKKAAEKKTARPGCAVLAVFFFFGALLSGSLAWALPVRDDPTDRAEQRDALYRRLCTVCGDALVESLRDYYDRGDFTINPALPAFLAPGKTNLVFEVEDDDVQLNGHGAPVRYVNGSIDAQPGSFYHEEIRTIYYAPKVDQLEKAGVHEVTICYSLPQTLTIRDGFYYAQPLLHVEQTLYYPLWAAAALFAMLTALCAFLVLRGALRDGGRAQSEPRIFRELPPDLLAVILLPAAAGLLAKLNAWRAETVDRLAVRSQLDSILMHTLSVKTVLLPAVYAAALFAAVLVWSAVVLFSLRRAGIRGLFSYTRFERIAFTRKTVPTLLILQSVKIAALLFCAPPFTQAIVYLALEKIVLLPVLYRLLREMRAVTEQTEVYVQGDLSHKISEMRLYRNLRMHGEDVDSIAQRIRSSADEYIRSGRFKAELITNLSHDIKTPLTSIINYAALLRNPALSEEERARYLAVLHRHSLRLGRLVEDLTQTSDAQAGKIEACPVRLDLSEVAVQSALGFEERLQTKRITLRFSVPQEPVSVMADMRLLWRVCDNLMNNICKYAAPDSEASITVTARGQQAEATFENVPAFDLELSGDALMERFVRADDSRHTEGNGLGLSIARSLMHVQQGELRIRTRRNRFTATLTLPSAPDTHSEAGGQAHG